MVTLKVLSEDIRKQISYGSLKFKKVYNLRSGGERIFSRLLDLCMQNLSVRGLQVVSNHYTIAHITVLLVALTAVKTGNKDKIRFVKSFLPNIYFLKSEFSESLLEFRTNQSMVANINKTLIA